MSVQVGELRLTYARDLAGRFGFTNYQGFCRMLKREGIPHVRLAGKVWLDESQVEDELRRRLEVGAGRKRRSSLNRRAA